MNRTDLAAAYRATTYRVEVPGGAIDVRIGEPAPALDPYGRCWGIVTACNPGSVRQAEVESARRQAALEARVTASGWRFLRGCNVADAGDWPPEPTLLIPDIDAPAAMALAADFGQSAVVVGEAGGLARLVWIDGI